MRQASQAVNKGDFRRAHEILAQLVTRKPDVTEARLRFGQLLRMLGHHARSRDELKHAELDSDFAAFAYFERFRMAEVQPRDQGCPIRHLMKSLAVVPTFFPSMCAAMKAGAISRLRVAVTIDSALAPDEYFSDAIRRGFNDQAARLLTFCLCLDPKSRIALFWGSRIARSLERQTIEQKLATWAAVATPADAELQMFAATACFKAGDLSAAEFYARRSLVLSQDKAEAWFILGRLLWLKEETAEAAQALARAARLEKSYEIRAQIVMAGIDPADFSANPPPLS